MGLSTSLVKRLMSWVGSIKPKVSPDELISKPVLMKNKPKRDGNIRMSTTTTALSLGFLNARIRISANNGTTRLSISVKSA